MEAFKQFLKFESSYFPVVTKFICVSLLRCVIVYAYINLALTLISLPILIFMLSVTKRSSEDVPELFIDPTIQLPLNIALISEDVVLTVILLIGLHKKRLELLKIYFFGGLIYNILTIAQMVAYFDDHNDARNVIEAGAIIFNIYMLFNVYNAVYILKQQLARAAEVQYVTYRDQGL